MYSLVHSSLVWSWDSWQCSALSKSVKLDIFKLWSWAFIEKLTVAQLGKKYSEFFRTRRFITVTTRACHWTCPESVNVAHTLSHYYLPIYAQIWKVGFFLHNSTAMYKSNLWPTHCSLLHLPTQKQYKFQENEQKTEIYTPYMRITIIAANKCHISYVDFEFLTVVMNNSGI